MKLTIISPSAQYLEAAGTRIRYRRMREPLSRFGWSTEIVLLDDFKPAAHLSSEDLFLFSKVQDARGVALAQELRSKGARVGVDLFDDYFSQVEDARFAPQRLWLASMASVIDFYLCSTRRMEEVARNHLGAIPGHVLNDPFDRFDAAALGPLIEEKRAAAIASRRIKLLWFGIGDNPNFPVGLHDLDRFGQAIAGFDRHGFRADLKILTNARALDTAGLARLRRLPVRPSIEEWSEGRERELIKESLVSFLPVNAQKFSIAKSLNRAVTALTGGTQLLTAGFRLYDPLSAFIYDDAGMLVADLASGRLRVSSDNLDSLSSSLSEISHPGVEAEKLALFLRRVAASIGNWGGPTPQPIAIIHGERSAAAVHKFARERQWLSLGSPLTPAGADYDAHLGFFGAERAAAFRLSSQLAELLPPRLASQKRRVRGATKGLEVELPLEALGLNIDLRLFGEALQRGSGARMALHAPLMEQTRWLYSELFGPLHYVDAELHPLLRLADEVRQSSRHTPASTGHAREPMIDTSDLARDRATQNQEKAC